MDGVRALCKELTMVAKNELGESPDRVRACLKAIKEWLVMNPHLYINENEQFLVNFVRGCKFSLEKVKEKLDAYYTMQTAIPEIRENRDPLHPKTSHLLKSGVFIPIPTPYEKDAPIIYLVRCGTFEVDDYSFPDALAVAYINIDILLSTCDNHAISGQTTIIDLKLVDMHVMSQMTPLELQRAIHFNKNVIPIRTKAFHFINAPSFFLKIYNGIKGALPHKLRERMMVHAKVEDLHKYIPKKALPSDYDGDLQPISQLISDWEALVMTHRDRLLTEKKYGVDESKRQSISKQDILKGGSFRKLEVD